MNSEQREGPRARKRQIGQRRQSCLENSTRGAAQPGINGSADHGAESPNSSAVAVLRTYLFQPTSFVSEEIAKPVGARIEGMVEESEVARRQIVGAVGRFTKLVQVQRDN